MQDPLDPNTTTFANTNTPSPSADELIQEIKNARRQLGLPPLAQPDIDLKYVLRPSVLDENLIPHRGLIGTPET